MSSIIDTLEQGEMWYGQDDLPYRIKDMETSHVMNVLGFLRRRAEQLIRQQVHREMTEALRGGYLNEWVEASALRLGDEASAWLERRPLMRALKHELILRDTVDGEAVEVSGELPTSKR